MNDEHDQPRTEETDLVEVTSRLGEPESIHRTNQGSVIWRFVLGVSIVLAASGLHYVLWTGQIGWPRGVKLWIIALAGMFVGPGVGLYLITFAIRGMKLAVLIYPTGLFVLHRGRVIAFPWEEVKAMQISGLPEKAVLHRPIRPDGMPETVWYDLVKSQRRVFGTTIILTRIDGEQVSLISTLDDFPALGRRIQEETFRRLFPVRLEALENGSILEFGTLSCDRHKITVGKKSLLWIELDELKRVADQLHLKRTDKKKAIAKCELNELVNLHVLMGIATVVRGDRSFS